MDEINVRQKVLSATVSPEAELIKCFLLWGDRYIRTADI
jgi:hypothetical protein